MTQLAVERIGSLSSVQYGTADRAVLFLYPPGEERKGCVRLLHQVAQYLMADGWSAVCFDYFGDGDSPGDFSEMTWDSLGSDIAAACAWMQQRYRTYRVCALRLGSLAGLEFVPGGVTMIFTAPVFSAGQWLEQARRRSRFRDGDVPQTPDDIDGYLYNKQFQQQLAECPDGIEMLRKRLETLGDTSVKLLSFGAGSSPDKRSVEFARVARISPVHVRGIPFWLQGEAGEYGELPQVLASLCMED